VLVCFHAAAVDCKDREAGINVSTLDSHLEVMGDELDLVARFPDGSVKISKVTDLGLGSLG
jgi:hypothetical protein